MKKVLGLLLVFLMISALACGCSMANSGGKSNANAGESNESKEESLDSEVYKDELKAFEDIIPIPEFEIDYAIVTSDGCSFRISADYQRGIRSLCQTDSWAWVYGECLQFRRCLYSR